MKTRLISLILAIFLSGSTFAAAAEKPLLQIGVVPQFETLHLRGVWLPILDELASATGYRFELISLPSIPAFEKELNKGTFDFAYMNPYHLLMANSVRQQYTPLVRDVGRTLQGILVVKQDSPIYTIEDLHGAKIAFPAPNAFGASLLIRAELRQRFHIDFQPLYVNTHSSVFLNVLVGQVQAGGAVQKTLNQQDPSIQQGMRVLYRSQPSTPHPFAVHQRISIQQAQKVQQAFLALATTKRTQMLLAKIPMKRIGQASLSDYQALKQMDLDKFYVTE